MRPDQIKRLQELEEALADVFIMEADPKNWSGAGKLPVDMTREERGDRHWDKKGSMGTGGVLRYTIDLLNPKEAYNPNDDQAAKREADLDASISRAQADARKALERVLNKAQGKPEFDKRVRGGA